MAILIKKIKLSWLDWIMCVKYRTILLLMLGYVYGRKVASTDFQQHNRQSLQMIYWQVKPFIYWDEVYERMDGIYPIIFRKGEEYCRSVASKIPLIEYVVDTGSRTNFDRTIRSNSSYGEYSLQNVTSNEDAVIWGPFDFEVGKTGAAHFLKRNLTLINLASSSELVVIQPRYRISLTYKLAQGVCLSWQIILFILILALLFGITISLCERSKNRQFKGDYCGPCVGVYWSFVTMTSVGYGDVIPITFLGRLLSIVCMFIGLIMASTLTATLTDAVNGVKTLSIVGRRIGVLENSHEEYFVERDQQAKPVSFKAYKEVLEAVRENVVYAAVLPYEVAAWMQHEIRSEKYHVPLSIVYKLKGIVPFTLLLNRRGSYSELFDCMFQQYRYDVVTSTELILQRGLEMESTFYGDFTTILRHSKIFQITLGVIILVVLASFFSVFRDRRRNRRKQRSYVI